MRALVTGGNRGIGFGIAKALGARDLEIILGVRDEARGTTAVAELARLGFSASFVKIDLNDLTTIEAAAASVGKIDLLINNAGVAGNLESEKGPLDMSKSAFDYTTDDLRATMETNFLGTHAVIKGLWANLTTDAKILCVTVPISSPFWQPLAYITSKAALNVMVMTFGRELDKEKSRRQIFGVMPGAVATELNGAQPGSFVKSADVAGAEIAAFLFDGKNHNGKIVNSDGKEIASYEPKLMQVSSFGKDFIKSKLKHK